MPTHRKVIDTGTQWSVGCHKKKIRMLFINWCRVPRLFYKRGKNERISTICYHLYEKQRETLKIYKDSGIQNSIYLFCELMTQNKWPLVYININNWKIGDKKQFFLIGKCKRHDRNSKIMTWHVLVCIKKE